MPPMSHASDVRRQTGYGEHVRLVLHPRLCDQAGFREIVAERGGGVEG
jgi:hypothetical protein